MICPKCGKEYEQKQCPNCSKPEIQVNHSDYLKRKEIYEKKQAEEKSASSLDKDKKNKSEGNEDASDLKKPKKGEKSNDDYEEIDYIGAAVKTVDFVKQAGLNMGLKAAKTGEKVLEKNQQKNRIRKFNKKKIIYISCACAAILLAIIISVCYFIGKNDKILYTCYNGKIYNVAHMDSDFVCDEKNAFFDYNGKNFSVPQIPTDIDQNNIIDTMSCDDGKYMAAVTYNDDDKEYTVYSFKNDGSELKTIEKSKAKKQIQFVSSKGNVIYINTDVLNDEMYLGKSDVCISDESGRKVSVSEDIMSINIYAASQRIIIHGKDNKLFIFNYEKMERETSISDQADILYAETQDDNVFLSGKNSVNDEKTADALMYCENKNIYYYDINNKESWKVCSEKDANAVYIYEKKDAELYIISSKSLDYGKITDNKEDSSKKTVEMSHIDDMNSLDYFYIANDNRLVYRNSSNELTAIKNGKKSVYEYDIQAGSLKTIENTNDSFIYIKNDNMYYKEVYNSQPVEIDNSISVSAKADIVYYEKKLYFYTDDKELYSCSNKGKSMTQIGEVSRFFAGKQQ